MRTKTVFASLFTITAALAAIAGDASAALPIKGSALFSQSVSKSAYKDDFGASFAAAANASATDFAQGCETTSLAYQCGAKPPSQGIIPGAASLNYQICANTYAPINAYYCARNVGSKRGFGASGSAQSDVRLFGTNLELFDMSASATTDPLASSTSYQVYVAGYKVVGASGGASLAKSVPLGERTLVQASGTFMLGPVPITVTASAVGSLGIDFALGANTSQVTGTVTPHAQVDGIFSAGVGVSGFSAGIEGELMIARLEVPATAKVVWQGNKSFAYEASLDLSLSALDGTVSLYAEGAGQKATWEITSWEGVDWSTHLGKASGTFSL